MRGVKLVVSDAHEGIKATVAKVLNASWQRCRVGPLKNRLEPNADSGRGSGGGEMAMIIGQYERGCGNLEKAQKSERQPLQVDSRGDQEGLDPHVLKTASDCARESM